MILHPDFPRTPYIYVNYTHSSFAVGCRVSAIPSARACGG